MQSSYRLRINLREDLRRRSAKIGVTFQDPFKEPLGSIHFILKIDNGFREIDSADSDGHGLALSSALRRSVGCALLKKIVDVVDGQP